MTVMEPVAKWWLYLARQYPLQTKIIIGSMVMLYVLLIVTNCKLDPIKKHKYILYFISMIVHRKVKHVIIHFIVFRSSLPCDLYFCLEFSQHFFHFLSV